MAINELKIPYADFKLNEIIDPEEFDLNNKFIVNKVNEVLELLNTLTDSVIDGNSGGDNVAITPIDTSPSTLQGALEWLKEQINTASVGEISDGAITDNLLGNNPTDVKERFKSHISDPLPHTFVDGGKTYKYGWRVDNGVLKFNYQEV